MELELPAKAPTYLALIWNHSSLELDVTRCHRVGVPKTRLICRLDCLAAAAARGAIP